jgi:hypothetical protein
MRDKNKEKDEDLYSILKVDDEYSLNRIRAMAVI